MSIISSEAKWAVIKRAASISAEEARATTNGKEYVAGFIAGATRQPTDEEIEAMAKALYDTRPFYGLSWEMLPGGNKPFYREQATAVWQAMQGKVTEE